MFKILNKKNTNYMLEVYVNLRLKFFEKKILKYIIFQSTFIFKILILCYYKILILIYFKN